MAADAPRLSAPAEPESIATRAAGNTVGQQETQQQQQQDQQEHQENELEKEKENEQENEKENEQENIQQQQDALFSYTATLQYDGTHYWGWQLQPPPAGRRAKPTIQLALEKALVRLTGEPREELKVQAAGRTDAGVHARGQVAQWYCRRQREPAALLRGLNALLPADIRAVGVQRVPLDFNVRYALQKTYSYDIHMGPVADPFLHRFRHHPRRPDRLRLEAIADVLPLLVGTHDFSHFANFSPESARKSPVKTILRYQLLPIEGGARLEVEGSGFLYKQVRHMTGALLAVGSGLLAPDAIAMALATGPLARSGADRNAARGWMVAEAKGLCLQEVVYFPSSPLPLAAKL